MDSPRSCSDTLVGALTDVGRRAGLDIDRDALTAALGVAWSPVAAPAEPDIGNWSLYARDAFLVETGRLFGLEIRGIHPPQAARGLRGAAEFAQHFDASYRPLIHRALEHGQPLLAWQGWPGPNSLSWGVITGTCDDGVGLRGTVGRPPDNAERHATPVTLLAPPVQLYVVERITPARIGAGEAATVALDHARTVLDNGLSDRFGVITGPQAFDEWAKRLQDVPSSSAGRPEWSAGHTRLLEASIAGYESIARLLQTALASAERAVRSSLSTVAHACRNLTEALSESTGRGAGDEPASLADRDAILTPLRHAKSMIQRLRASLPP